MSTSAISAAQVNRCRPSHTSLGCWPGGELLADHFLPCICFDTLTYLMFTWMYLLQSLFNVYSVRFVVVEAPASMEVISGMSMRRGCKQLHRRHHCDYYLPLTGWNHTSSYCLHIILMEHQLEKKDWSASDCFVLHVMVVVWGKAYGLERRLVRDEG